MGQENRREKGLYWDRAWKLVEGCMKCSEGCLHCWSETETAMRRTHPNAAISTRANSVLMPDANFFSGSILLREDNLDLPLRVKKPTIWAVWNDLFHEDVPVQFVLATYEVMLRSEIRGLGHTFLVLTKRAERMASMLNGAVANLLGPENLSPPSGVATSGVIWHGVTCENQDTADERIPHLLRVPGKRFVSVEPMLGWLALCEHVHENGIGRVSMDGIHAVILGGESGYGARPMHCDWVRSVRDQCAASGTPFYFKQGYGVRPDKLPFLDGVRHASLPWD